MLLPLIITCVNKSQESKKKRNVKFVIKVSEICKKFKRIKKRKIHSFAFGAEINIRNRRREKDNSSIETQYNQLFFSYDTFRLFFLLKIEKKKNNNYNNKSGKQSIKNFFLRIFILSFDGYLGGENRLTEEGV